MSNPQQQPISVYTIMMIVSTIFMFFACLLMGIEYFGRYGGTSSSPAPSRVHIQSPGDYSHLA